MSKLKFGSKSGVTLIELLVVVLIVVILAVAMLPVLEPFITRAKYAADAIPALGNLRTQISLYKSEKEYLPGLQRTSAGQPLVDPVASGNEGGAWGTTTLNGTDGATFNGDTTFGQVIDSTNTVWVQQMAAAANGSVFTDVWLPLDPANDQAIINNHYAKDLQISGSDYVGNNVKAENIIYAATCGGYKGNKYLYVVGAFGDGDKLKSGTGYAILEVQDANNSAKPKFVATWRRWKPGYNDAECTVDQMAISFVPAADFENLQNQDYANNVYIPFELIQGAPGDQTAYDTAITALRTAGWEF